MPLQVSSDASGGGLGREHAQGPWKGVHGYVIPVLGTSPFRVSLSSGVSFGGVRLSKNLFISLRLCDISTCWLMVCLSDAFIQVRSVVLSLFHS